MRWLRLRALALQQRLPGIVYAEVLVLGVWLLVASLMPMSRAWVEWVAYIACPALLGIGHLLAPRRVHGGRPYWALTFAWLGAACLGGLAHWKALDPATPWLSLARYGLIVVAVVMVGASLMAGRPSWVAEENTRIARPAWFICGAILTALFVGAGAYVVGSTSFPLALAPQQKGTTVRQLLSFPDSETPIWFAWSPDSRSLLMLTGERNRKSIWLTDVQSGRRTLVARGAGFSDDRPWAPDGSGFYYTVGEGQDAGVWFCSADPERRRLLMRGDEYGFITCSPDGRHIAYGHGDEVWVGNVDGSGGRMVGSKGGCAKWSPDGRHLLFFAREGEKRGARQVLWVASLDGEVRRIPAAGSAFDTPEWLNSGEIATLVDTPKGGWSGGGWRSTAVVEIWDVSGTRVARRTFDTPAPGIMGIGVASSPDGRRIAMDLEAVFPTAFAPPRIFILDAKSGGLSAVPVPGPPFGLKWSPNGEMLALDATAWRLQPEDSESRFGLYLVSGL